MMDQQGRSRWVGTPRCGVILKISKRRDSMFVPNEYRCTMPKGHDKGKDPSAHRCVIAWKEPKEKL